MLQPIGFWMFLKQPFACRFSVSELKGQIATQGYVGRCLEGQASIRQPSSLGKVQPEQAPKALDPMWQLQPLQMCCAQQPRQMPETEKWAPQFPERIPKYAYTYTSHFGEAKGGSFQRKKKWNLTWLCITHNLNLLFLGGLFCWNFYFYFFFLLKPLLSLSFSVETSTSIEISTFSLLF